MGPALNCLLAKLIVTSVVWSNTCLLNISVKKQVEKNIILILRPWWWPTKFPKKKLQGRFQFDHIICSIPYERYHMVHMIWSIYITEWICTYKDYWYFIDLIPGIWRFFTPWHRSWFWIAQFVELLKSLRMISKLVQFPGILGWKIRVPIFA